MKKVLLLGLFSFLVLFSYNATVSAEEETVIELYPYDQIACLEATSACTNTKIGDSHWDVTFNGYNYNVARGNARFVADFDDADFDGFYTETEYPAAQWTSFGGVFINDTDSEAIIKTANARGDMSNNSTPRIWVYFDENGDVVMYEDHYLNKYDVFNAGTTADPDWRFATEAEMTALTDAETVLEDAETAEADLIAGGTATQAELDAAAADVTAAQAALDPIAEVTKADAYIRIKADDVDTDGYVMELLPYLGWKKVGAVEDDPATAEVDETDWSDIVEGDPNNVTIPAGWTVFYFGYLDRSGANQKTMDWSATLVDAMLAGDVEGMMYSYDDQAAWFTGLTGHDDDPASDGVNMIVDYNGTFNMPTDVSAQWLDMFDENGKIINKETKLDFAVEISDLSGLLETITYTWMDDELCVQADVDAGTLDKDGVACVLDAVKVAAHYDMSAEQTVVDSSEFGKGYTATFIVTTPEMDETAIATDIAVGVLPPAFDGVEDRYIDENTMIDLMEGITSDDGYGNDLTSTIEVTAPAGFNPYSPNPGVYDIDLTFTHHIFIPGMYPVLSFTEDNSVQSGGSDMFHEWTIDTSVAMNPAKAVNQCGADLCIWDDLTNFDKTNGWSSVVMVVGADGKFDFMYERYGWTFTDENGFKQAGSEADYNAWADALVLEDGAYLIAGHGTSSPAYYFRFIEYDTPIHLYVGETIEDFNYDIVTDATYKLTVDDTTAPYVLAPADIYIMQVGTIGNVDHAILSNIVAFDNYDSVDDLAIYVSDNGGLDTSVPGSYEVEVTAEDLAGNVSVVTYTFIVQEAPLTEAEITAIVNAAVENNLTETEIQTLIDAAVADSLDETEIQALIDASVDDLATEIAETGCSSSINPASISIVALMVVAGAGLFLIKRR